MTKVYRFFHLWIQSLLSQYIYFKFLKSNWESDWLVYQVRAVLTQIMFKGPSDPWCSKIFCLSSQLTLLFLLLPLLPTRSVSGEVNRQQLLETMRSIFGNKERQWSWSVTWGNLKEAVFFFTRFSGETVPMLACVACSRSPSQPQDVSGDLENSSALVTAKTSLFGCWARDSWLTGVLELNLLRWFYAKNAVPHRGSVVGTFDVLF